MRIFAKKTTTKMAKEKRKRQKTVKFSEYDFHYISSSPPPRLSFSLFSFWITKERKKKRRRDP